MIMNRRWKLVFNDHGQPYFLTDQQNDFEECHNRINDPSCSEVVEDLQAQLFRHLMVTQVDESR